MNKKRLTSVFTDDLEHCFFTGKSQVDVHHIYAGPLRKKSGEYGFVVPLSPELHPNGVHAGPDAKLVDINLKQRAQRYYEAHYGTRNDFINEFIRSYL